MMFSVIYFLSFPNVFIGNLSNNMNKKAKSFVTIMVVVAVSALLLRLAIHRIIIYNIQQNQRIAQGNLKLLSTALEN